MKRSLPVLVLSLALTVVPTEAVAKEITKAKLCGASGCRTIEDRDVLAAFPEGGPPVDPPGHGSGWYRVTVTIDDPGGGATSTNAVLPRARYLRTDALDGGYVWMRLPAHAAAAYRSATRGLEPFPATTLRGIAERRPPTAVRDRDDGRGLRWLALVALAGATCVAGAIAVRRGWAARLAATLRSDPR